MSRKIYITESQLRNLLRRKINEDIMGDEQQIDINDIYNLVQQLCERSDFEVYNDEWLTNETLRIYYRFNMDTDEVVFIRMDISADVDYSYEYEKGRHYDNYGNPGTPDYFEDDFDFKFDEFKPENVKIIAMDDDEKEIDVDENTFNMIINKLGEYSKEYYEENYNIEKYRDNYCYRDDDWD
jgi:hypothetical protein